MSDYVRHRTGDDAIQRIEGFSTWAEARAECYKIKARMVKREKSEEPLIRKLAAKQRLKAKQEAEMSAIKAKMDALQGIQKDLCYDEDPRPHPHKPYEEYFGLGLN